MSFGVGLLLLLRLFAAILVVIICPTMTMWLHTIVLFDDWEGNISCDSVDSLGFVLTESEKF